MSRQKEMIKHFEQTFPNCPEILVKSDLHAAGISALGSKTGFCIILGTGSVGFTWENNDVQEIYGGKGFPGGDFLGGADLGRRLISLLQKKNDPSLLKAFELKYGDISPHADHVSSKKSPSYFGQFAPFVLNHRHHPEIASFIRDACSEFFSDIPDLKSFEKIGIVGSIGSLLKDEIQEYLGFSNYHNLTYIQHPINNLIDLFVTHLKSI